MAETVEQAGIIYRFEQFEIDIVNRLLLRDGRTVPLTPKIFDILLLLVENNGRMVTKDEIMASVWADTFVEETNLTSNISRLRKILHEGGADCIETMPKHGYRFKAKIEKDGAAGELILTRRVTARIQQTTEETETGGAIDRLPAERRTKSFWKARFFVPAAGLAILLAAGLFVLFWSSRQATPENAMQIKSLAILPFKPLVTESRNESLELGMTDTLISKLGSSEIVVRPLSSVRRFGNVDQDPVQAGQSLGVDSVLDGSVQRWGDKIRVNVRLIRIADGSALWTGTFDEKFTDIFVVQDAISRKVASALTLELSGDKKTKLEKRYTNNVEAYQLYLKARNHAGRGTPSEVQRAISYYQQAIEIDPNYALAYIGLSGAYVGLAFSSEIPATETMPKAKVAANKAVEIDDTLAEAHSALSDILFWYDWDWNAAEKHIKRALELNPNGAGVQREYAGFLSNTGRQAEALVVIKRAIELDPPNLGYKAMQGLILIRAQQYDEGLAVLQKVREQDPGDWYGGGYLFAISGYTKKGMYAEAIAIARQARELSGVNPITMSFVGQTLAKAGKRAEAQVVLEEMLKLSKVRHVSPHNIAMVYNALEMRDETFAQLELSYELREPRAVQLKVETKWDNLHDDPRFQDLLRRMGLPQ